MLKYLSEPRLPATPAAHYLAWSTVSGLAFMIGWVFIWGTPLEKAGIVQVGLGFSLLVGFLYILFLFQEDEGIPRFTWQRLRMTPIVMLGWCYPYVIAYLAGAP